jgi:transcription elongation factor GreB
MSKAFVKDDAAEPEIPEVEAPSLPSHGKNYITPDGFARLQSEKKHLLEVERPEVVKTVAWAASLGDRSENADYIYGKRRLREIDRRVRFLRKRLDGIVVVDRPPDDPDRIFFGAWVQLVDDGGAERELRIVGPDEIDPVRGYVSMDSPLARALMGRRRDDEVGIDTPSGARMWTVIGIRYTAATG